MEAAILAVVRASRLAFRSGEDKLAFAVHAFLLAEGFKLVAAGAAAEDESTDWTASKEEVGPAGWESLPGAYAFRYQDTEGKRPPLYLKCIATGVQLLVHWVAGAAPSGSGGAGAGGNASAGASSAEPCTLELDTAAYTTDAPAAPDCYKAMPELLGKLRKSLGSALDRGKPASAAADQAGSAAAAQQGGEASGSGRGREEPGYDPLRDYSGPSSIGYRPPGVPVGIGAGDVVPPGFRPPGYGGGPVIPGLLEPGPLQGGGGMHVGPGDPLFGPGRMGGGRGAGPGPGRGGLPAGARWDPIAPPGMRGFNPDNFQHPPGQVHPDMAQPGPGRGTDWDNMFG